MSKRSPKNEIRKLDVGVFALYRNNKFVRSFDSKRAAMKTLAHVNEDTRKPAAPVKRIAPTPHKFIVKVQLKSGKRKSITLRSSSMAEAAALFFPLTGLTLSDLAKASIMYNGSRKARDLTEVL